MQSLLHLTDLTPRDLDTIFATADDLSAAGPVIPQILKGKTIVAFFPSSSIRTRATFEKGIHLLGGQLILFPSDALDKKESLEDVAGYLSNFADCLLVRHPDARVLRELALHSNIPVINAMTSQSHPCEVLSDLYALSHLRQDLFSLRYTYVGHPGNIGLTWCEAAQAFGLSLRQCCPEGYEMEKLLVVRDIHAAVRNSDVILTDSLPSDALADFASYQITKDLLELAGDHVLFNPCPPFYRGEEVAADAISSTYFVGYDFKTSLVPVQQSILLFCLGDSIKNIKGQSQ